MRTRADRYELLSKQAEAYRTLLASLRLMYDKTRNFGWVCTNLLVLTLHLQGRWIVMSTPDGWCAGRRAVDTRRWVPDAMRTDMDIETRAAVRTVYRKRALLSTRRDDIIAMSCGW
jgi:hypothetical protein